MTEENISALIYEIDAFVEELEEDYALEEIVDALAEYVEIIKELA